MAGCTSGRPLAPAASKITHLVVLISENHTFDNYFGRYCTAPTGSNPSCTNGPACCEAAPNQEPATGIAPTELTDEEHSKRDPNHHFDCELEEIHGGKMDRFVTASCGSPRNFAYAPVDLVKPYHQLAQGNALADRFFQPIVGESTANDLYFARARFVFKDNAAPPNAIGRECSPVSGQPVEFSEPTLGDLLTARGVSWSWYHEGYREMIDARKNGQCPTPPEECPAGISIDPCTYNCADSPFSYFSSLRDNPSYFKDFEDFATDLASRQLPSVSFIKPAGYHAEHPGFRTTVSDGVAFVGRLVSALASSPDASSTLFLLVYDEGGGYFDHVAPPASVVDGQPYGTRVPLLAVGPLARKNWVSHVPMEHSSIVRFIEWNWLGATGLLQGRDAVVANLGSLLDPAATGTAVPE